MSLINKLNMHFLLHLNSLNTLRVKRAEQFCIPSTWLIFIVLDVEKTIRSIVEHFGDDERAFPRRSELGWLLLVHSENHVSFLKCPTPYVSGMESTQVLLINGRPDQGHLSFFFQEVDCISSSLFCFLFQEEFNSGSIVEQITRKYDFGSID